jgi:hypothetical protein
MQSVETLFAHSLTVYTEASERSVMMEAVSDLDRLIERRASCNPDPDELEPSYADRMARSEPKGVNHRGFWEFQEAPNAPACKAAKTPKTGRLKMTPCKPGDPMSFRTGCYPRSYSSAYLEGIL